MNEYTTVWQGFLAMIGLSCACLLYSLGGRSRKWKRRFVGSFILACTVNGLLFWRGLWFPLALTVYPALACGFSMGYGTNGSVGGYLKFTRRFIYAIGVLLAGLILVLHFGGNGWILFVAHAGVGLWSIWLGMKNPIEAAAEEIFICALLCIGLVMYPFIS